MSQGLNMGSDMSSEVPPLSLDECAQFLCADLTKNEGVTLAARVLVESLTPGLRHFNAVFKEVIRAARNTRAPEVEALLNQHHEFEQLIGVVCASLKAAQSELWWQSVTEVAECGAQRNVLARLISKQIASSAKAQEMRAHWQRVYLDAGGAAGFIQALSKDRLASELVPIQEVVRAALSHVSVPAVSTDQQIKWLSAQRQFIEAALSQGWREARDQLRELVKISPQEPTVYLYWSLSKCAEGKVTEAINGVYRAAEVAPNNQKLSRLSEESALWREAIESERDAQRVSMSVEPAETRLAQTSGYKTSLLPSDADSRHASNLMSGGANDQSSRAQEAWFLPAEMLQALADLGPERTLDVSVAGLMGQLYHLLNVQKAHLRDAQRRYPEASGLNALAHQLSQSQRLVERGLGVYKVDPTGDLPPITIGPSPTGLKTLSAQELAELRRAAFYPLPDQESGAGVRESDDEAPPPIPTSAGEGVAPTEMVMNLTPAVSISITPPPQSIDSNVTDPLDFTLEPEVTDLARAQMLMQQGEFTQAEHCLLSLLDQNPFDAPVHNDLGVLYFQIQRFGDAKAHLMLAIECDPQYEEAWSNLVELFASLGHLHHALPFFRRFQTLVETSASLRKLRELCAQFAPEGLDQLPPPRYEDTSGLKLPLSGSFFISPMPDESVFESIAAPLPLEWDPAEEAKITEERERVQQEHAVKMRAEINALLDNYARVSAPPSPPTKRGVVHWLKKRIGLDPSEEPTQAETFHESSPHSEETLNAIYDPGLPAPPPPRELPEDLRRVRNIAFSMLCVPAGSFKMGTHINSPYGCANETPQHTTVISRPFQLARVPITQEFFQAVMFRNPSHIKAPGHPVVRVSWFDAVRFCNALSELEGLPPAYLISQGARPEVAIRPQVAGYRLPTESEWEYCARGRQPYRYAGSEEIHRVGWAQTDQMKTVARKDPNGWGFYDMSGNVWEWCQDAMREYTAESQLDPHGEMHPYMHTPSARVIRGGSWCFEEDGARVAFRGRGAPGLRISSLGFRIARSL